MRRRLPLIFVVVFLSLPFVNIIIDGFEYSTCFARTAFVHPRTRGTEKNLNRNENGMKFVTHKQIPSARNRINRSADVYMALDYVRALVDACLLDSIFKARRR